MAADNASSNRGSTSRKSAAKKSTTKKASGRKSPSKKPAAKKTGTRKTAVRKTSSGATREADAPRAEARRRQSGPQVAEAAARQLGELTGKEVEGVTGLERGEDGWRVDLDVLELRRVPNTTDVIATYEVTVDSDGELMGYRRLRRYVRGAGEDR